MVRRKASAPQITGTSVTIEGLTVSYDGAAAVRDLDLKIEQGELLVLLGPSGCGKTSTLRAVAGLETPSAGRISVGDEVVFDSTTGVTVPPNRRHIGMVFQSYAVWPHMTVAQNVGFPLRMQRRPRSEVRTRVDEVLELVGLTGMATRGASKLSGGQMQRVALARSLAMRPNILLLDEPLSNLDAKLRERLRFELRDVQQETGVTSIYVTHDQTEAFALADRVAVMADGRIEQLDRPQRIYSTPCSRNVADFLGVENILRGVVTGRRTDGLIEVSVADGALQAVAVGNHSAGATVELCFRSESVEVVDGIDQEAGEADNTWTGKLRSVSFLGAQWRYEVELADGVLVEGASAASAEPGAKGDACRIRLRPKLARLLDGPADG